MNDLYSLSFISYGGLNGERGGGGFLIFFRWKGGGGGLIWEGGLNRGFTVLLKIFCLLSPRSPSQVWGTRHRTNFRPVEFKFDIACEQALLFGQAKRASRERETRLTRPNRRDCSQAKFDRTLCSHRTVQYFRSVHREIVTVRRLNFRTVKVVPW